MIARLLSRGLGVIRNDVAENPSIPLTDPRAWESMFGFSYRTESGVSVTPLEGLKIAALWQCVSTVSWDIAAMTLNLYQVNEGGDREEAEDVYAHALVSDSWNTETAAELGWQAVAAQKMLYGNSHVFIHRKGGAGELLNLYNTDPTLMSSIRIDGKLYYEYEKDLPGYPSKTPIPARNILHFRELSLDGVTSMDPTNFGADDIGMTLAATSYGGRFFANGAQAGGVIEVPPGTTEPAAENLARSIQKKHSQKENWFKLMVLREGAKFHATTIDAQKAQLTELLEAQVRNHARRFKIPPYKVGLQDSVSYNSATEAQRAYVTGCLLHQTVSIRSECRIKLLTRDERRRGMYFEHNASKLLETDAKTLNEVLEIQRRNEIISANEWRKKINLPKRTDDRGDDYTNPNVRSPDSGGDGSGSGQSSGESGGSEGDSTGEASANGRSLGLRRSVLALVQRDVDRIAKRLSHEASAKARKSTAFFTEWLDSGFAEHRTLFADMLSSAMAIAEEADLLDDADPELATEKLAVEFFSRLALHLKPFVEPPYAAKDLEKNVTEACAAFAASAGAELVPLVLGE